MLDMFQLRLPEGEDMLWENTIMTISGLHPPSFGDTTFLPVYS